jgi:hypothetical protein
MHYAGARGPLDSVCPQQWAFYYYVISDEVSSEGCGFVLRCETHSWSAILNNPSINDMLLFLKNSAHNAQTISLTLGNPSNGPV